MSDLPALTIEMAIVFAIVGLAVVLFATELLRVDATAIVVMTLLGLLTVVPGIEGLVAPDVLFSGLSSNAVVAIIAVMILGRGLDQTGVMDQVARFMLRHGGRTEQRVVTLVSGAAAVISSFMQNVGAAALLIPVTAQISARTRVPLGRLVMPMGFCAILGGTVTMVGSSPLIMLNDLIDGANVRLPAASQMPHFDLFAVAPVGVALVLAGIAYFVVFGRYVLPTRATRRTSRRAGTARYMRRVHGIDAAIREVEVPVGSSLVGRDIRSIQREYEAKIVATQYRGRSIVSPSMDTVIAAPATIAVIAQTEALRRFVAEEGLVLRPKLRDFRYLLSRAIAGIAEIVVPPDSALIGKNVRDLRLRATYGLGLLSIVRAGKAITSGLGTVPFQGGDTLICHTRWQDLARLETNRNFVIVTADYPRVPRHPYKATLALGFLALSLALILLTPVALPVALLAGAAGMIVTGVLTIDDAYAAVSWKSVFLLAGLLPLGHAMEASGAANYLAVHIVTALGQLSPVMMQALIAALSTVLTLVVSNVGATALLVPIAINVATATGSDPAMFALTVAVSTSNSFMLPTHQVNALLIGPGEYRVADFLRAGTPMTVLYLLVSLLALNLLF